jgi:hypothetical protein
MIELNPTHSVNGRHHNQSAGVGLQVIILGCVEEQPRDLLPTTVQTHCM